MWNWLVSALASECTLLLYDGSPFHPTATLLSRSRAATLGTSAKYTTPSGRPLVPKNTMTSAMRMMTDRFTAGSGKLRLAHENVKEDFCLASISGVPTSSPASSSVPHQSGLPGETSAAAWGRCRSLERGGRSGGRGKGRAGLYQTLPLHAHYLNDPDGSRYRAASRFRVQVMETTELTRHGGSSSTASDATLNPEGYDGPRRFIARPSSCQKCGIQCRQEWKRHQVILFAWPRG